MSVESLLKTPVKISEILVEPNEEGGFFASAMVKEPGQKPGIVTALGETREKTIKELFFSIQDFQDAFWHS
jgi:hypothetical protein